MSIIDQCSNTDGTGATNSSDDSADGPVGHVGGADKAHVCDTHDKGGSADRDRINTGGGGDACDGHAVAWGDHDAIGGGDST